MNAAVMNACPLCQALPELAGMWSFQVRCSCGACGPKRRTRQDAVTRWNSVAFYIQKFRDSNRYAHDVTPSGSRSKYNPLAC